MRQEIRQKPTGGGQEVQESRNSRENAGDQTRHNKVQAGQGEVPRERNHTETVPPLPRARTEEEDCPRPGLRVRRDRSPAHLQRHPSSHKEPHQSRGPQEQNTLLRPRGRSLRRPGTQKNGKTENRPALRRWHQGPRPKPEKEERNQRGNRKRRENGREKPPGTHREPGMEGNRKTGQNPGRHPGSGCGQTPEKRPPRQSPKTTSSA